MHGAAGRYGRDARRTIASSAIATPMNLILRTEGVDIGKADYVPHMFAYLRPGAAPGG